MDCKIHDALGYQSKSNKPPTMQHGLLAIEHTWAITSGQGGRKLSSPALIWLSRVELVPGAADSNSSDKSSLHSTHVKLRTTYPCIGSKHEIAQRNQGLFQ